MSPESVSADPLDLRQELERPEERAGCEGRNAVGGSSHAGSDAGRRRCLSGGSVGAGASLAWPPVDSIGVHRVGRLRAAGRPIALGERLGSVGERELIRRWQDDRDRRAQEELVRRFLPAAGRLARRYARSHESIDDLTQAATVGLISAIDRFLSRARRAFRRSFTRRCRGAQALPQKYSVGTPRAARSAGAHA